MKKHYKNDFMIGSIYNPYNQYGRDKELLINNFNVITAENLMKPEFISISEGTYNWLESDTMLAFAEENGLKVIGHTLVWHQQTPSWLTEGTPEAVSTKMESYINTVVGRYKGRIYGWDVVNEALRDDLSIAPTVWSDGIRKMGPGATPWYKGNPEYIYEAYVLAHNADPNAELYYNDYNLDNAVKREAAALLVEHINARYSEEYKTSEKLITAIGMQAHYCLDTSVDDVRASIERFKSAGVKVNITELDICLNRVVDNGLGTERETKVVLSDEAEQRQAEKYAELMMLYKENSDIIDRVTFWGYNDARSWRAAQFPLMFNGDLSPKKAYYAIINPQSYIND